jgi:TP53 regulating kinase-like protein
MGEVADQKLMKKGAEASLYTAYWHGKKVTIKMRLPKKYRLFELDDEIRMNRTVRESLLIHEAKRAGVPTPSLYFVDVKNAVIIMEFIEGKQVKQLIGEFTEKKRRNTCLEIGKSVGRLHKMAVIHGDLTTSNMILNSEDQIIFVDFGLGEKSTEMESQGVDLHLMKRSLESTHFRLAEKCFQAVIDGYSGILGSEYTKKIQGKIEEIENRGRYVSERKGRQKIIFN